MSHSLFYLTVQLELKWSEPEFGNQVIDPMEICNNLLAKTSWLSFCFPWSLRAKVSLALFSSISYGGKSRGAKKLAKWTVTYKRVSFFFLKLVQIFNLRVRPFHFRTNSYTSRPLRKFKEAHCASLYYLRPTSLKIPWDSELIDIVTSFWNRQSS